MKKFTSDIDIDFADRNNILSKLQHTSAAMIKDKAVKHATGVYFTDIPKDPFTGWASLDYQDAEDRGYIKLDFLNLNIYNLVRDEAHLIELMNTTPRWDKLYDIAFCEQLIHIGSHYNSLMAMPEPVDSIARMAMFLAVIRPAKRHLIGKTWREVAATVWDPPEDGSYYFKKAHSVSYGQLVVIHMNLLDSAELDNTSNQSN